jgi:hypothetical protein
MKEMATLDGLSDIAFEAENLAKVLQQCDMAVHWRRLSCYSQKTAVLE